MLAPNTKQHTLGISRAGNGTRLWLEGKRLINHGFAHGTPCHRHWALNRLVITPCDQATFDALERDCRTTIAGSPARPIVDITGEAVARTFPSGAVLVAWSHGRIEITGA